MINEKTKYIRGAQYDDDHFWHLEVKESEKEEDGIVVKRQELVNISLCKNSCQLGNKESK